MEINGVKFHRDHMYGGWWAVPAGGRIITVNAILPGDGTRHYGTYLDDQVIGIISHEEMSDLIDMIRNKEI